MAYLSSSNNLGHGFLALHISCSITDSSVSCWWEITTFQEDFGDNDKIWLVCSTRSNDEQRQSTQKVLKMTDEHFRKSFYWNDISWSTVYENLNILGLPYLYVWHAHCQIVTASHLSSVPTHVHNYNEKRERQWNGSFENAFNFIYKFGKRRKWR